ncbi:Wadjet anti-phage system protein JetA family protein [Lachnospiraceae bacterium 45-P1]
MIKLFEVIPSGFFNCLSSGSNSTVYSDCLQIIYEQYDREITYRIARSRIRDALAAYLLENHVDFLEAEEVDGGRKNYNDLANGMIRRFCSKEIGWLEEDNDDATYEKHIIMTEQGILLAEFLQQLRKPERGVFQLYLQYL